MSGGLSNCTDVPLTIARIAIDHLRLSSSVESSSRDDLHRRRSPIKTAPVKSGKMGKRQELEIDLFVSLVVH